MQSSISYWQSCWQKSVSARWVIHSWTAIYDSDSAVFYGCHRMSHVIFYFFPPTAFQIHSNAEFNTALVLQSKSFTRSRYPIWLLRECQQWIQSIGWLLSEAKLTSHKLQRSAQKHLKVAVSHWQGAYCSLLPPTERVNQVSWLHQPKLPYTLGEVSNSLQSAADLAGSGLNGSAAAYCLQLLLLPVGLWAGGGVLKLYLMMLNTHKLVYSLVLIKGFQRRLTPAQLAVFPCTTSKKAPCSFHSWLEMTLSFHLVKMTCTAGPVFSPF